MRCPFLRVPVLCSFPRKRCMAAAAWFCIALGGCNQDRLFEPKGTAHLVHIAAATGSAATIQCTAGGAPYEVRYRVTLVNTTADTVWLHRVASHGWQKLSAWEPIHVFESLPFTPIVVRSRDGEATTHVTMTAPCPRLPGQTLTTLYLYTNAGQFASPPIDMLVIVRAAPVAGD